MAEIINLQLAKTLISNLNEEARLRTDIIVCPVCGYNYQHLGIPFVIDGNDNYEARWGGRGDLTVIPVYGECGCKWELCFGEHKGNIESFVRIIMPCDVRKYLVG